MNIVVLKMEKISYFKSTGDFNEPVLPVSKLLNLKSRSKYIEKTPNELLDMHISLVAEAYDKYRDKYVTLCALYCCSTLFLLEQFYKNPTLILVKI